MLNKLQPLTAPFPRLHDLCDANEGFLKKIHQKKEENKSPLSAEQLERDVKV